MATSRNIGTKPGSIRLRPRRTSNRQEHVDAKDLAGGWRRHALKLMPAPPRPNPNTPEGKEQLRMSMLTCSQQVDSQIFAPDAQAGMLLNAMIVESFGIRGGKIHEVEAMP